MVYSIAMPDIAFSLPSFAKINLGLRVLGKRPDGFHEIFTVFQTVSLHDTLSFELSDELTMTCNDAAIPCDERNLIIRAGEALQRFERLRGGNGPAAVRGAQIHLDKRIPSPGGLGGGSSNAAVALIGLARLWEIDISTADLGLIASELGSDVPFFLTGGTACGTGRGTDIEAATDLDARHILIVTPDVAVSTSDAFNALNAATLTNTDANHILQICRFDAESRDSYLRTMRNDFENTVFSAHPEIGAVKESLLRAGAVNALMSGSGASVFGLFDIEETRQTAIKALDEQVNWRKFSVATISRAEYRDALGLV